ncbi:MAG: SecDF P1 head subdomain-containing protein [Fimbriimonas sp.]
MTKIRSSTKIAIGFAVLVGGSYFGYKTITDQMILTEKFTELVPAKVNFVGIDPGAGYRIVIANQVAQLVQADTKFQGKEEGSGGATEGAIKKRMPLRELIGTLSGDAKALGSFVMILNDMREDDNWPTVHVIWKAEDIKKAIAGDATLRAKLESDLNVKLDGTPLTKLRISSLENGIIVDFPVTVMVNMRGVLTEVVGRVQKPFKPQLIRFAEKRYLDKNVDETQILGYYSEEARVVLDDPSKREDVAKVLTAMISPERARELAKSPEQVLKSAKIILTDEQVTSASYRTYSTPTGRLHDLTINLTDEGRRRLWQYSKKRIGTQLLLIADGVAIAAPRIQQELAQGNLTITQMRDEVLLRDATDMLNKKSERTVSK